MEILSERNRIKSTIKLHKQTKQGTNRPLIYYLKPKKQYLYQNLPRCWYYWSNKSDWIRGKISWMEVDGRQPSRERDSYWLGFYSQASHPDSNRTNFEVPGVVYIRVETWIIERA